MLQVNETYVNATKGYQFGDSGWYTPYTEDKGRLFRNYQREYGRCVSKVYVDLPGGKVQPVGWVFEKRMEYEDARRSWSKEQREYVREVWVTYRMVADEDEEK